jgi:chain length determinant protein (polysaccharide antigen chain regulator)
MKKWKSEELLDDRSMPDYIKPASVAQEEISVVDLWMIIAKRKRLILFSMLGSLLVAGAYLVLAEPLYKSDAWLLPPQPHTIRELIIGHDQFAVRGAENYTPEMVYSAFLANLRSHGLRREFFDSQNIEPQESENAPNTDRIFELEFNRRLQVQPDKINPEFVTVSFSHPNPATAAKWLNAMISFANRRTIDQLLNNVKSAVGAELDQVRRHLASELKLAKERRRDRIAQLEEALRVAKALGINDSGVPGIVNRSGEGLAVNTAEMPLYMRGAEALESEIQVLASRKSDEPFITNFRDLQERRNFLESISIDPGALSAVRIDEAARIPYRAEKPKTGIVLGIALTLGALLGIVVAFIAPPLHGRNP